MNRPPAAELRHALRQRVIYADTDQMGFVYHGTYTRFLEAARVELMRSLGHTYAEAEAQGYGMPLTDLAISYLAPARRSRSTRRRRRRAASSGRSTCSAPRT